MTSKEYLAKLGKLYPKMINESAIVLKSAEFVWAGWELNSNIDRPDNIHHIASNFRDEYTACFDRLKSYYDGPKRDKLILAYFPIIDFNAKANSTKDEDRVIIYDEYLNAFITQFLLICINLTYNSELSSNEVDKCKDYLEHLLLLFKERKKTDNDKYISYLDYFEVLASKDFNYSFQSAVGCYSIFYFILAHEIGHHYFGHTSKKEKHFLGSVKSEKVEIETYKHLQEYEADEYGFQLFLNITKDVRDNDNTNINEYFDRFPLLYFDIMTLYYEFLINKGLIQEIPKSHPSPIERKNNLLSKNEHLLSEEGLILYNGITDTLTKFRSHKKF